MLRRFSNPKLSRKLAIPFLLMLLTIGTIVWVAQDSTGKMRDETALMTGNA